MSITTQTPTEIAQAAADATERWDAYDPEQKFLFMLRHIHHGQDDLEAEVIAACRLKAGL